MSLKAAPKRIHFVRHGLSAANLSQSVNRRVADHAIELAEEGHEQARAAGEKLAAFLRARKDEAMSPVRVLVSPYRRTRQTAEHILSEMTQAGIQVDVKECLQLREQSFGLFDGYSPDELAAAWPNEFALYQKNKAFEGEFYSPMPLGESRAQVCDRVRTAFGPILDAFRADAVSDVVCISHGVTIRCAIMEFMRLPWEWCEHEPNPSNCSITTITGQPDRGWKLSETFAGFEHPHTPAHDAQEERETGIAA